MNPQEGEILYIDKPLRWTSFDVVNKVRWLLCKRLGVKKLRWDMPAPSTRWLRE